MIKYLELINVKNVDAGDKKEEDELLENIIRKINERFEGKFTEGDRVIVETIYNKCLKDNVKLKKNKLKTIFLKYLKRLSFLRF